MEIDLLLFTIKSRREVDFRTAGFYIPEFRNKDLNTHPKNEELKQKYISHMKYLFNTYGDLVDNGIDVEDARFILPYSFHSNIIMGLNARELEKMVTSFLYGPLSKISELKRIWRKITFNNKRICSIFRKRALNHILIIQIILLTIWKV